MAKTRIKTTPTRLQKDALMASTATAAAIIKPSTMTCLVAAPLDEVKKRLRHPAALNKPTQSGSSSSTIIVTAPKRTNSISSIASSISQISDAHSDTESPPPQHLMPSTATTTTTIKSNRSLLLSHAASQAPRTLNNLLCKPTNAISMLRNRKVFMITEKLDEVVGADKATTTSTIGGGGGGGVGGASVGQKRKMYLIMEENSCNGDGETEAGGIVANDAQKYLKRENGLIVGAGGSKKLTLFADKADSVALTEKFEKILPEILHRIQAKDASTSSLLAHVVPMPTPTATPSQTQAATASTSKLLNGTANLNIVKSEPIQSQQTELDIKKTTEETNERLPITLPPKKNRTKIITTHINNNNTSNEGNLSDSFNNATASIWGNYNSNNNNNNSHSSHKISTQCQIKQISAATPVIVSAVTAGARNNNHCSDNHSSSSHFAINNNNHNNNYNDSSSNNTNIRYASKCNGQIATSMPQVELVPQKNINLSTDFHFLIKMLPKLESIPEPHKNNVKNCIEKIITQNANIFAKQ